jgi:hypothetical protein
MNGITLKNPVINSVPIAIMVGRKDIDVSGTSLSTGLKANNDVISSFLGQNLGYRAKLLGKICNNIGYSNNIVKTAHDGLDSIAQTLTQMLAIINSVGGSKTSVRTLNDMFQLKLEQISKQTTTVEFGGIKLFTGEFGSDATIKSKYNTEIVDVRKMGIGAGTLFEGMGAKALKVIDVQNIANIAPGDEIRLDGVSFKMVQNKEVVTSENDIAIETTEEQTVCSIANAIKNHSSKVLRAYNVTARNKQVIITQLSASTSHIPLIIRSQIDGMIDNSDPSNYSFKFVGGGPTVGSKLTISGVTFEYVANGATGGDPTKVEVKDGPVNGAKALSDKIQNHPTTKDLIGKRMLHIQLNNIGFVAIRSTLNRDVLGFTSAFNLGDIDNNTTMISGATTCVYKINFTSSSLATDVVNFVIPGVGNVKFNMSNATSAERSALIFCKKILLNNSTGKVSGGLIHQGKLCLERFGNSSVVIYSDYDLQIQYTGQGDPVINTSVLSRSTADVVAMKPAINVSKIRNMEGFIGNLTANVKVIDHATSGAVVGDDLAAKLYSQVTGGLNSPTVSTDGDSIAVLHIDIAGRTFRSVVWQGNGSNLNNRELVFTENSTGDTFSINTKVLDADIITIDRANATLAETIKILLSSTKFTQVRDLEIDTSGEKIIDDGGRVIGNVEGMTVSLNSTDFSNKQFEDFVIIPDPIVLGNTSFITTINAQEFVCKVRATELNEGKALTFNATNGDTLTINVGKNGINSLLDPKNYKYIASAMKKSLMKVGSGIEVRTGFDSDNVTKLVISDISATKLYRNNQNKYVPKLDLLTKESAKVAQEVITNALNLVYSARAKLQGQGDNLDRSANVLNSTISVTKDASSGYLDTDLVEAASAFAAALKSILAAVSTLQAGAKAANAGLEIIKSAA